MNDAVLHVNDPASLEKAINQKVSNIEVEGRIADLSSLKLPAGTNLRGAGAGAELHFKSGQMGLMLSSNHHISSLRLMTDETQIAIGLSDDTDDLGTLEISDLKTVGRIHLEASQASKGHLKLNNIHVERADAAIAAHRPSGFGVEVLIGGIVVYNFSKNRASRWTLEARNLSGGSQGHPLRGSGVFIFGGWFIPDNADMSTAPAPSQEGGTIEVKLLTTGEIHANGGLPKGTSNLITGGVFIGSGVHAHSVINEGAVTTYGANDMVLDNWGRVESWLVQAKVTSYGDSGIGFVNFGDIKILTIKAPIETHGLGARGFNLYDGWLKQADFQRITTYGDGAIAVQLSKPFGTITVQEDLRTKGGKGDSLVRGKLVHLKAHALSLKKGTMGGEIKVNGQVIAENEEISDYDFEVAPTVIGRISVGGKQVT